MSMIVSYIIKLFYLSFFFILFKCTKQKKPQCILYNRQNGCYKQTIDFLNKKIFEKRRHAILSVKGDKINIS